MPVLPVSETPPTVSSISGGGDGGGGEGGGGDGDGGGGDGGGGDGEGEPGGDGRCSQRSPAFDSPAKK